MTLLRHTAAAAAALALLAVPTTATAAGNGGAEQLRKLDIMLMVTSLRCRTGADNFQGDYQRFSAAHLAALNTAAKSLQAGLVRQAGAAGAKKALDKISVGMANEYGRGHPWLGCGELKKITQDLGRPASAAQLADAADALLSRVPAGRYAQLAAR